MSRQRLRPSLGESSYMTCPRCSGIGNIRSVESLALAILRLIGEEARKERTAKVIAQLPVEVATYLLNEKRNWVQSVEARHDTQVVLVANPALETPHYQIRRVRDDQVELPENSGTSYRLMETADEPEVALAAERKVAEPAAVETITPSTPAPVRSTSDDRSPGLLARIFGLFTGRADPDSERTQAGRRRSAKKPDGRGRSRRRTEPQRTADRKGSARPQKSARKRDGQSGPERAERSSTGGKAPRSGRRPPAAEAPARERQEARGEGRDDSRKKSAKRRSRGGRRRKRADGADASMNPEALPNRPDADAAPMNGRPQAAAAPSVEEPRERARTPDAAAAPAPASPQVERTPEPRNNGGRSEASERSPQANDQKPASAAPVTPPRAPDSPATGKPAAGRLLPWEPTAPVDKPAAEKAAPDENPPGR
jgi:ribonuclease E